MLRKRRWRCREAGCARESFTETIGEVPFRRSADSRLQPCPASQRDHRASVPTSVGSRDTE